MIFIFMHSIMPQIKKSNWSQKLKQLIHIPVSIRWVSLSLFLFMMGWGLGGDTFFSIYIKEIIGTGIGLTLIGTLLPIIKLLIVIPIWILNDQWNSRYLLLCGKIFYALSGFFYFMAGIEHSATLLILAVIINGVASSTMFTTYRTLYGKKSQTRNRSQIFGIYFSSINLAYVIWALISTLLVKYLDLPYMYLFVVIFALLSILQDGKIQDFLRRNFSKSRHKYRKKQEKNLNLDYEVNEDLLTVKKVIGKKGILLSFFREVFSLGAWRKMFQALQSYGWPMYIALSSQSLVNFINYVSFLFIPLIAIDNNLSLSEIAILFAVMRVPYLVNILIGNVGDKYNKKILITLLILAAAILFFLLGNAHSFSTIVAISFGLSLVVAIFQPISAALILGYAKSKDKGLIAGMQEFTGKIGEIIGSLGFGILTTILGMHYAFQVLGLGLFVLGGYLLTKKLLRYKTRDNEAEKERKAQLAYFTPKGTET